MEKMTSQGPFEMYFPIMISLSKFDNLLKWLAISVLSLHWWGLSAFGKIVVHIYRNDDIKEADTFQ